MDGNFKSAQRRSDGRVVAGHAGAMAHAAAEQQEQRARSEHERRILEQRQQYNEAAATPVATAHVARAPSLPARPPSGVPYFRPVPSTTAILG